MFLILLNSHRLFEPTSNLHVRVNKYDRNTTQTGLISNFFPIGTVFFCSAFLIARFNFLSIFSSNIFNAKTILIFNHNERPIKIKQKEKTKFHGNNDEVKKLRNFGWNAFECEIQANCLHLIKYSCALENKRDKDKRHRCDSNLIDFEFGFKCGVFVCLYAVSFGW